MNDSFITGPESVAVFNAAEKEYVSRKKYKGWEIQVEKDKSKFFAIVRDNHLKYYGEVAVDSSEGATVRAAEGFIDRMQASYEKFNK